MPNDRLPLLITDEVIRDSLDRGIETMFGDVHIGQLDPRFASGGTLPPRWPTTNAPRTWDHDYDMMQRRPLWVMDGNDERCRVVLWNIDPHFVDRNAIRVVAVHGVSVIEFDVGRDIESLRNEQDGINYIEHEIALRWERDIGTRCYVKRWHPDWQRGLRLLPEDLGRSRFHIHGDAMRLDASARDLGLGSFAEARRRDRTATVIPDHKPNDWEA